MAILNHRIPDTILSWPRVDGVYYSVEVAGWPIRRRDFILLLSWHLGGQSACGLPEVEASSDSG